MIRSYALDELAAVIQKQDPALRMEKQALMAGYTTLHLGGPADLMAHPATPEQLRMLLMEA